MATLTYWLWLTTRRGFRPEHAFQLLEHFGTPEGAYFADPAEYELLNLPDKARAGLLDKSLDGAEDILGECDRLNIRVLTVQDAEYPDRLKHIFDPPAVLYVKGKLFRFDEEVAIGVVGTRHPTPYGVTMAGRLGFELAQHGALVVSGIAQGLDAAALRGALKGGGSVVSVLGNGIDVHYPRENQWLYEDVAAAGALISEYPPGTDPTRFSFPQRNRILSGLSLGVVAVECTRERSGTMVTMGLALDQDRDVFAVPGNADAPMSEGTNYLIRRGATLVTGGWDILQEYEGRFPGKIRALSSADPEVREARLADAPQEKSAGAAGSDKKAVDKEPAVEYIDLNPRKAGLPDDQIELLSALGDKALTADDLVELAQIPAKRVLTALTMLQLKGFVAEKPGKRFESKVRITDN
ncbi:MAG: DNA-protecting protein DprA [Clostridia bacterium]|nr:DNA-protecting protein DprA [Clostridia bacterium]